MNNEVVWCFYLGSFSGHFCWPTSPVERPFVKARGATRNLVTMAQESLGSARENGAVAVTSTILNRKRWDAAETGSLGDR